MRDPLWVMIEGPDGAGKTSIAQRCMTILGRAEDSPGGVGRRPVVMQCLSFNTPIQDYIDWPFHLVHEMGCHVVQDRGVISGPVYEPIMRNDQERLAWMLPLVPEAAKQGATVLYVDAALDVLEKRVRERGDDYIKPSHLEALQAGYVREMARWQELGGQSIEIDTTEEFPDDDALKLTLSLLMVL